MNEQFVHYTEDQERQMLGALLTDFSQGMLWKLLKKFDEGETGWDNPEYFESGDLEADLRERIDALILTNDPLKAVDIANFAMFMFYHMTVRQDENDTEEL